MRTSASSTEIDPSLFELTAISTGASVEDWNLRTNWTPFGKPVRRIDGSAIAFGLENPPLHVARLQLGIPWDLFRRDWNRIARGIRDKQQTRAARRVLRHAGACLFTEKWTGNGVLCECA